MEGKPRPTAAAAEAIAALDDLVATNLVGREEFARNLGLSVKDLVCFAHVLEADGTPVTAGDLAGRAHVTTGAVTGILNRLERGGFVARCPDTADRRRVLITAVPAATERVQAVYGPYTTLLTELSADYSPDEIAVIADWLKRAGALAHTYLDGSC
ncbi:MarR family winged helix-turn-helix transcriptional regulator [Streptomyces sp. NPDC048441]|uniref:MarR family winged helix-turn-helix transcriptional regulator n=1 Tax=Streptomyces sp. NPDC048441 TaxID=3365552 RepID=UPI003718EFD3